jgi:hypothetical protein
LKLIGYFKCEWFLIRLDAVVVQHLVFYNRNYVKTGVALTPLPREGTNIYNIPTTSWGATGLPSSPEILSKQTLWMASLFGD